MLLLLTACNWNTKDPVDIHTAVTTNVVCINEPTLDTFTIRNVNFVEVKNVDNLYYIGMTTKEYENLALNHTNMKRNMKQKNTVILYYRKCLNKK